MKKLIYLFVALVPFVTSCVKSTDPVDPYQGYVEWYGRVTIQNDLSLDPFNVAYRLDVYLNEKVNTPTTAEATKAKLFENAEITTTDNIIYKIKYNSIKLAIYPKDDFSRQGTVIVDTKGVLLSEDGAVWSVYTTEEEAYEVGVTGFGSVEIRIDNTGYTIEQQSNNKWLVVSNDFYSRLPAAGLFSVWNTRFYVTQTAGTQTQSSLETAQFSLETESNFDTGGKDLFGVRIKYDILSPVLYATKCGFMAKSGGEERLIQLNEAYKHMDTVLFDRGKTLECGGTLSVTRRGVTRFFN